jgi:hypothetical protein
VKNKSHQNVVLLYTRGIKTDEKCNHCAKGAGTFYKYILAPKYIIDDQRRALFVGAYSNYI